MRMETIWQLSVHGPGVESTVRFFSNIFISMVKTPTDFFWGMLITVTFNVTFRFVNSLFTKEYIH